MAALLTPIMPAEAMRSWSDRNGRFTFGLEGRAIGPLRARWNTPDWCLPTGLNCFADACGQWVGVPSGRDWLVGYTLAPYFQQTIGTERRSGFEARLLEPSIGPRRPLLPTSLSEWFLKSPVLCPECDEQAVEEQGFSWVQRSWLLPFVTRCPVHGTQLAEFPRWTPLSRGAPQPIPLVDGRAEAGVQLSAASAELLVQGGDLLDRVGQLLQGRGFTTAKGSLRRRQLVEAVFSYTNGRYEHAEFSHMLSSRAGVEKLLSPLWSSRATLHPAVALVLMPALAELPEVSQQPLALPSRVSGSAVVAALAAGGSVTSAASAVGVSVQTALARARAAGLQVSARPKRVMGELRRAIEGELARGMAVAKVARKCKVSLSTVYRIQQGSPALTGVAQARAERANAELLAERQQRWSALMSTHPTLSMGELRELAPADYAFLYRQSRGWPDANRPGTKALAKNLEPRSRAPEGADFALARRLQAAAGEVHQQRTQGALLSAAGRRDTPSKSSATEKQLVRRLETQAEYVLRRLFEAAKALYDAGEPVVAWRVIKRAGLRDETVRASAVDVEAAISSVLRRELRKS